MTTDILTTIDDAIGDQLLLERIRARAARPGMAAYPNGGYSTLAGAVAAERRALDDEVMGWRPRAFKAKRIGPALNHASLKGKNLLAVPADVDTYRPAGPPQSPEPVDADDQGEASAPAPVAVLCGCSQCLARGDTTVGHETVGYLDFFVDEAPVRRRRGLTATIRALFGRRGRP